MLINAVSINSYATSAILKADTVNRFKLESRNDFGYITTFSNEVYILEKDLIPRNFGYNP